MKNKLLAALLLAGVELISTPLYAATINITASFTPDMKDPSNNTFKNTTPQSGYCASWPGQCSDNKTFSVSMGGMTASLVSDGFKANSFARDGMYFKMPGDWRTVSVINTENGEPSSLKFRVNAYSARYLSKTSMYGKETWNGGNFVYAPYPCLYSGVGWSSGKNYSWMWKWPASDSACFKTAKRDLIGEPYEVDSMSFGYELSTPAPLSMGSGLYKGTLVLAVGPDGDIDFGDNLKANDSTLTINFTLTVTHELKVTPLTGATDVTLYPCYHGTSCTQAEADKNWERWMVTNVTPQKMSGRSEFNLSSSGGFTVYMQCGSGAALSNNSCAMTSTKSGTVVPVQAVLTLPDNITDTAGQRVINKPLFTEKNKNQNKFQTKSFGVDKKGWVDFVINQKEVKEMLKTRPDSWEGTVTLVFDPNLY